MTDRSRDEPQPRMIRRRIASGEARVAVFTRTYHAAITDVWDACVNPERLARWYTPVSGDLRRGGRFDQTGMSSGVVEDCEPPTYLRLSLADGADEIELRLSEAGSDSTRLELQHATTIDRHDINGTSFDAIFCVGGGYYPRLQALGQLLEHALPVGYDPLAVHLDPAVQPLIERGSNAMNALLIQDAEQRKGRPQ